MRTITMKVNGVSASHDVPDNTLLVSFLRETMGLTGTCLLYTSPSPRDRQKSRMPSSA